MGNPNLLPKYIAKEIKPKEKRKASVRRSAAVAVPTRSRGSERGVAVPTRSRTSERGVAVPTRSRTSERGVVITKVASTEVASSNLEDTQPSLHSDVPGELFLLEMLAERSLQVQKVGADWTPKSKAVVPAELEQKRGESDGEYAKRLKEFVEKQCSEMQDLRYHNSTVEAELYTLEGLYEENEQQYEFCLFESEATWYKNLALKLECDLKSVRQANVQVEKEKAQNAAEASGYKRINAKRHPKLKQKSGESGGEYAKRLKEFVEKQCVEMQDLRYHNANVESELSKYKDLVRRAEDEISFIRPNVLKLEQDFQEKSRQFNLLKAEKNKLESEALIRSDFAAKLTSNMMSVIEDPDNSVKEAKFKAELSRYIEMVTEQEFQKGMLRKQKRHSKSENVMDAQNILKQANVQVEKEEQKAHNAVEASADQSLVEFLKEQKAHNAAVASQYKYLVEMLEEQKLQNVADEKQYKHLVELFEEQKAHNAAELFEGQKFQNSTEASGYRRMAGVMESNLELNSARDADNSRSKRNKEHDSDPGSGRGLDWDSVRVPKRPRSRRHYRR